MNKNLILFLKYHTVEEGKNMDREKLNLRIYNVVYKDGWIKKGICWIVILLPLVVIIRALVIYWMK